MSSATVSQARGDAQLLRTRSPSPYAAGATDIGQRAHNEDQVLLRPELGLFLLADGAGGHNAGNIASALGTATVANVFESSGAALADRPDVDAFGLPTVARRLSAAIHRANGEIIDIAKKSEKYHGMGTTLVALALALPQDDGPRSAPASSTGPAVPAASLASWSQVQVHVAHVGDSRCYRLRAGVLERLTVDHSLMNDVLEAHPEADDALLARTPRHVVTRALGMEETVRVSVRSLRAAPGDIYVLCSDGLTGVLEDDGIEAVLLEPRTPDEHVQALIHAALAAGAQDNIGVVVVACRETEAPPRMRNQSIRPAMPTLPAIPPGDMTATKVKIAAPSIRAPAGSAPEIIIVGVETHVVPSDSADAKVLDAVGRLSRPRP